MHGVHKMEQILALIIQSKMHLFVCLMCELEKMLFFDHYSFGNIRLKTEKNSEA